MAEWNQARITKWATDTFGEPSDLVSIADRADVEFVEFIDACYDARQGIGSWDKAIEEMADVYIVMCQIAEHLGQSLQCAVDAKMEKNSKRVWKTTGDGVGRHQ